MFKFNFRIIITLIFLTNFFFQEKLYTHNKFNGGCQNHCSRNKINSNQSNAKKFKNIKFENYKDTKSCVKTNLCRG